MTNDLMNELVLNFYLLKRTKMRLYMAVQYNLLSKLLDSVFEKCKEFCNIRYLLKNLHMCCAKMIN